MEAERSVYVIWIECVFSLLFVSGCAAQTLMCGPLLRHIICANLLGLLRVFMTVDAVLQVLSTIRPLGGAPGKGPHDFLFLLFAVQTVA